MSKTEKLSQLNTRLLTLLSRIYFNNEYEREEASDLIESYNQLSFSDDSEEVINLPETEQGINHQKPPY